MDNDDLYAGALYAGKETAAQDAKRGARKSIFGVKINKFLGENVRKISLKDRK